MGTHTWTCPGCRRQVPLRVAACHCGTSRDQAEAAARSEASLVGDVAPARARPEWPAVRREPLPRDVKAFLAAAAVVLILAVGWIGLRPYQPQAVKPVLGIVVPAPRDPTPAPPPPRPPFKLPWWK